MTYMSRRQFLKTAGLLGLGLFLMEPYSLAANSPSPQPRSNKRLVVIFLRGAVDGLNVVIPSGDPRYYDLRPNIAIPEPGQAGGALALDHHFSLHPALSGILPLWQQKSLAFIHASGSPETTRSHFDAQDYMESGTPGIKTTSSGWMNRLLEVLPGPHTSTQALNFGPTIPRILAGKEVVANMSVGRGTVKKLPIDNPIIRAGFDKLYNGHDPLSLAYQEGKAARQIIRADLQDQEMVMANNGAPSPSQFLNIGSQLGHLIKKEPRLKIAFTGIGGWDTHINQGASSGQLARNLQQLGEGIATMVKAMGNEYQNTTILVMSEFGRTVRENGNKGTDHGHGNVMWIMGGNIHGGKIYGDWAGLGESNLYEKRDLPVTTDFRSVLGMVLTQHLGLNQTQLSRVLPQIPAGTHQIQGLL